MLKKLREEKRQSLRPPSIRIPTAGTPTFITAPQQLIEAPDGSVTSKRVFPDGEKIIHYHDAQAWEDIQQAAMLSPCSPFFGDLRGTPTIQQAHSPTEPNFCGSPRINTPFSPLFSDLRASPTWSKPTEPKPLIYNGMSGKLLAIYTDKVIKIQAFVREYLTRKKWRSSIVKMQSVVRGGCVRMRLWREKCKKNTKILMKGVIQFQALARRFLVRMRMYNGPFNLYGYGKFKELENKNASAIKIQSVVRGGLVRMRIWRKKCEENDIILLNATIKIQALARRFLVRMRVWNVRSTNPEFASTVKSVVREWLLREPKKCVKHDFKPVRSGYDHTTYECRNCDYESGCV